MGKHSGHYARQSVTKAALVGGAAATAAAMTVGMAAPSATAATVSNDPIGGVTAQVGQAAANTVGGFFEVPVTLGTGLAESGLRAGIAVVGQPINFLTLADAIATGNRDELFGLIANAVDAPLWIADPTIDALEKAFPQYAGKIKSFRDDVLWDLTEVINAAIKPIIVGEPAASALMQTAATASSDPLGDAIEAFVGVAKGLGQSSVNAIEGSLLAPVSVVLLAAAVIQGKDTEADYLVQQMIDAPLWIAKPTLDALANPKVPAPIGGPNGLAAKVFDQAYDVRQAVRKLVLGSDVTLPNPNDPQANSQPLTKLARGSSQGNQQLVSRSSLARQNVANADGAATKQDKQDLAEISTPPRSVQPAPAKVNVFSIVRGPNNSSQGNQGRTTVNNPGVNVRNQLQGAADNVQNQLQNAVENAQNQVTNTVKRFTPTVGTRQSNAGTAAKPASEGTGTGSNNSPGNSNSK
ncbi:MAG: hypothetical protein WAM92_16845 [Mycobacterium sp.]